ncbi:class I SAM-dependent methyltransferase [Chloroflexota bacterium]
MDNNIDAVKITHRTYDSIASGYSSRIGSLIADSWVGEFERVLMDEFLLLMTLSSPSVLDIGCGNGKDANYLRQKGAVTVAVDISMGMIKEASRISSECVLCQMDMRNLGFAGGSFDGVRANGCIYHIPKAELSRLLNEIARVLKPSGIFSFNLKIGDGEKLEETPKSYQGGPRFYAYYSNSEIGEYLMNTGFELLAMCKYPRRIFDEEIIHLWCSKPATV